MKNRFIYLFAVLLFALSCSVDRDQEALQGPQGIQGEQGIPGKDGKDGITSLMSLDPFDGGITVSTGLDLNGDLVLSEDEILVSYDLFNGTNGINGINGINGLPGINGTNGIDGISTSVRTVEVDGGTFVYFMFGDKETVVFIEDGNDGDQGIPGTPGVPGTPGTNVTITTTPTDGGTIISITDINGTTDIFVGDGTNGFNALVNSELLETCELCEFGGVIFYYGLDENRNNILDVNEIYGQEVLCNVDPDFECNECNPECEDCDPITESKVWICHKKKNGNNWNFINLFLPPTAVETHLSDQTGTHEDVLGKCKD